MKCISDLNIENAGKGEVLINWETSIKNLKVYPRRNEPGLKRKPLAKGKIFFY